MREDVGVFLTLRNFPQAQFHLWLASVAPVPGRDALICLR